MYVDDMLIAFKSKSTINKLKGQLLSEFDMKDLGKVKMILGMEIKRQEEGQGESNSEGVFEEGAT